jgi:hypothetical protein
MDFRNSAGATARRLHFESKAVGELQKQSQPKGITYKKSSAGASTGLWIGSLPCVTQSAVK